MNPPEKSFLIHIPPREKIKQKLKRDSSFCFFFFTLGFFSSLSFQKIYKKDTKFPKFIRRTCSSFLPLKIRQQSSSLRVALNWKELDFLGKYTSEKRKKEKGIEFTVVNPAACCWCLILLVYKQPQPRAYPNDRFPSAGIYTYHPRSSRLFIKCQTQWDAHAT